MTNNTSLAWAAGFFEGEGSIDIKRRPNDNFLIRVVAVNTVSAYLRRLSSIFGGNLYTRKDIDKRARTQKRQKWSWEIGANKAYEFLKAILPYMTSEGKIEEARMAMDFQERLIGVPLTSEVLQERERLWGEIREIKHRDDVPTEELISESK